MDPTNIAGVRLFSQQIAETKFKAVKELVGWMGAMQAQDSVMVKWAVGLRLPNSTDQTVENALNNGEIIRTHLLRPTWHLVSADDIYWMLALTAPQIKASMRSRNKELELSKDVFIKSNAVLENKLRDANHLTREELVLELEKAKIATDNNRASHLFMQAELDGIICSGARKAGKLTYALLEERVPKKQSLTREEALANLAKKYFDSHSPATLKDFAWWSGLSIRDANLALESVKSDFRSETINSQTYWFNNFDFKPGKHAYFLPAFDEFIISYTDRTASLLMNDHSKAVSSNGIFHPVVLLNGQVLGIWSRTFKKTKVLVETKLFEQPAAATQNLMAAASLNYGHFLGKEIEMNHTFNEI